MGRVTATVLFTHLVGSTELRGRLGEEPAEALRRKHDRLLTQAVEAKGGRVVKGLGDGIMATFARAPDGVAAAVAIQQAVDRLNRSGKAPLPRSSSRLSAPTDRRIPLLAPAHQRRGVRMHVE